MPSSLPIETIEQIIDYLHNDRTSLLACSRVSSSWRVRAQHRLFRYIAVLDDHAARRFPLLAASPHLAAHIRVVRLSVLEWECFSHCTLPHVTDLVLYATSRLRLSLTAVQPDSIGKVFPCVRALTIDTARFNSWTELVHFVHIFPHLASLRLRSVDIRNHDPDPALLRTPPLSFTTLILDTCDESVMRFWTADGSILPHMPQLRCLRWSDEQRHQLLLGTAALVAHSAGTLEDLVIEVNHLEKIKAFAAKYKRAHGGVALDALRSLRLEMSESDDAQGDLADAARLALEIARDSQTHIELSTAAGTWQMVWSHWTAQLAGPHWRWRCTNTTRPDWTIHVYDGTAALEVLGITAT